MTAGGVQVPWGVTLAYFLAALLLILAMRMAVWRASAHTARLAGAAGIGLASATTLYTHNAAALPDLFAALSAGGAAGILLVRRSVSATLSRLVALLLGFAGLASMATGAALYLDPAAFVLADPIAEVVTGAARWSIGLTVLLGGIVTSGGIGALFGAGGELQNPQKGQLPLAVIGVSTVVTGFVCWLWGGGATWPFWMMSGLSLLAGNLLIRAVARPALPPAIAALTSVLGWSGGAMGVALDNPALLVGGAAAGTFAAILAVRLGRTIAAPDAQARADAAAPLSNPRVSP